MYVNYLLLWNNWANSNQICSLLEAVCWPLFVLVLDFACYRVVVSLTFTSSLSLFLLVTKVHGGSTLIRVSGRSADHPRRPTLHDLFSHWTIWEILCQCFAMKPLAYWNQTLVTIVLRWPLFKIELGRSVFHPKWLPPQYIVYHRTLSEIIVNNLLLRNYSGNWNHILSQ